MHKLSTLRKVELRDIWRSEAQDFTPWLAQDDNLKILGDAIGLELELEAQERNVGPFRADILCKDLSDDSWVLIENQLERTDHIHLGQLLTYAAGLQTVTIVWIAASFSEEHRAALDWLNEITDEKFRFFGLEVELWRIADSPAAPKFNIVSKPNNWSKSIARAALRMSDGDLSPVKANYYKYWEAFSDYLARVGSKLKPQKPRPQHWTNFSIGRSGFKLAALGATKDNWIAVELYMSDEYAKDYFRELIANKSSIDAELGKPVEWQELPEAKACRIRLISHGMNPLEINDWEKQFEWLRSNLDTFDRVFRHRIQRLSSTSH